VTPQWLVLRLLGKLTFSFFADFLLTNQFFVRYVGAGTVEFLIDTIDNEFYFCEMNTRLQVEHPVTEMITGLDLVEWQLRVAAGQPLPLTQEEVLARARGCALEARIYAENPLKNFLPGSGYLAHLKTPAEDVNAESGIRVDSGVISGNIVSTYYDPMIAKLITYADNRDQALEMMERALRNYQVAGLPNNIDFLIKCVRHPGFAKSQPTTAFFNEHMDGILNSLNHHPLSSLNSHLLVGLSTYYESFRIGKKNHIWDGSDEFTFWRANRAVKQSVNVETNQKDDKALLNVEVSHNNEYSFETKKDEKHKHAKSASVVSTSLVKESLSDRNTKCSVYKSTVSIDGKRQSGTVVIQTPSNEKSILVDVWLDGQIGEEHTHYQFKIESPLSSAATTTGASNPIVSSPMPGKIVKIIAKDGSKVKQGEPIIILEAMKMEHVVSAPCDG
jgi:3-methylcrotonyl-CoA carboxylase alpha subunit